MIKHHLFKKKKKKRKPARCKQFSPSLQMLKLPLVVKLLKRKQHIKCQIDLGQIILLDFSHQIFPFFLIGY